ncbi:MAG: LacI family DNA-binding transcriptional regulator [Actinomycetales bacterium]
MSTSMRDVAALASVSVGTVSNVLNNPQMVSPGTRERVEQAIAQLGFIPSAPARQLRSGRAKVIGLVVPDIANPFFTEVARGVEDAALDAGFVVILCNSDEQAAREDRYLRVLESQRVGAILITPARKDLQPLQRLITHGTAVALLDNEGASQDVCSVSVDDTLGGQLAAEHLINLGHRSIAWLAGPADIPQVADRESGIQNACRRHGIELLPIPAEQMTTAAGHAATAAAMARRRLPSAMVCANDLLALGAIRACRAGGLRIPQDVSIVGYDDIDFAGSAAIPLTTLRQPKYELGAAAARLVISEYARPSSHAHQRVRFQPQLVVRESTGRPHTGAAAT